MNYTNWVVQHEISLTSVMVIFRTPLDPLKVEGERKKNNKKKNVSEVGMERRCNMNFTIPAVSLLQPEASLILLDIFILLIS